MQRWETFRDRFEAFGVRMVALSPDTVAEAAALKRKRALGMTLLSDTSLEVIDLYNVRHEKGIAPKRGPIRPLAIPTTILIDKEGIVRWIDQTDDYRLRSDADRVLAAVEQALS